MKKEIVVIGLALAGASASSARGLVVSSEDDLSVVRRAVSQASAGGSSTHVEVRGEKRKSARGQWVKVRITEKGKGTKLSIDLPLGLVQGLGADIPLQWDCKQHGHHRHGHTRLSDVLELLDSGEDVVRIDAEGATIRVFVD